MLALAAHADDAQRSPRLIWSTVKQSQSVSYHGEPARSTWQRFKVRSLSLLPLDHEL
jgi:hypothetical protein